jgi:hypothetical protein
MMREMAFLCVVYDAALLSDAVVDWSNSEATDKILMRVSNDVGFRISQLEPQNEYERYVYEMVLLDFEMMQLADADEQSALVSRMSGVLASKAVA